MIASGLKAELINKPYRHLGTAQFRTEDGSLPQPVTTSTPNHQDPKVVSLNLTVRLGRNKEF